MKNNYTRVLTGGLIGFASAAAMAADPTVTYDNPPHHDHDRDHDHYDHVFRANEFSVDVFGTGSVGEYVVKHLSTDRVRDNGRLGWGLGVNYFFNRNFGLAAEGYTENAGHSFVDNASGSIVFRIPFDAARLAPYVFVGGGYQFDPIEQAFGHGGVGLEYRFVKNAGIFVDARYVLADDSQDFGLGRLGFRFSF